VEQATQTLPRPTTDDVETQTLPIDESAHPSKISTPTFVEQATQTLRALPLTMLKHKLCLLMNLPLLARSVPLLLWNKPLRPYLSLPLAMLKHKLRHGMRRQ
jgi:hypothetical protein